MLSRDVFGVLSSGRGDNTQPAHFPALLLWLRACAHRMPRPCQSDWRTLRVDGFSSSSPIGTRAEKGPQGYAPKGASPQGEQPGWSSQTSTSEASIQFAAFLCEISWL